MTYYAIYFFITFLCLRLRTALCQDFSYLGCFYDSHRREILPDLIFCNRTRHPYNTCRNVCGPQEKNYCQSDSMTIDLCRDICADQNMKYFGLEAGSQCLCGGDFAPFNNLGEPMGVNGTCTTPCNGNAAQSCGGDFQASIYRIDNPVSTCFNPGYVLNGNQAQQGDGFYNTSDVIDYGTVCPSPSIKEGAATITCTPSGNWTDSPPTCTIRCPTPTAPQFASFSAGQMLNDSYAVDAEVLFDCDNDPTETNQVLRCGYYGDWMSFIECPDINRTTTSMPTTPSVPISTTVSSTTNKTTITTEETPTNATSKMSTSEDSASNTSPSPSHQPGSGSTLTPSTVHGASTIVEGGPTTTSPSTTQMTMASTTPSAAQSSTPFQPTQSSSSMIPSSSASGGATNSGDDQTTRKMMSSSASGLISTPVPTGQKEATTPARQIEDEMDFIPIIIGAAAGILLIILIIIVVSVCCSRKRKRLTKNIPFDPTLGTSFGNPAFEDDEGEESRRGFVQENDYGDLPRQKYDIGVSDYAMAVDETDRAPPDGKDSPNETGDKAGIEKSRQESEGS